MAGIKRKTKSVEDSDSTARRRSARGSAVGVKEAVTEKESEIDETAKPAAVGENTKDTVIEGGNDGRDAAIPELSNVHAKRKFDSSPLLLAPEPRRSKRIRDNAHAINGETLQIKYEEKESNRSSNSNKKDGKKKRKDEGDIKLETGEEDQISITSPSPAQSKVKIKLENSEDEDEDEDEGKGGKRDARAHKNKRKGSKEDSKTLSPATKTVAAAAIAADLQAKKLKSYAQFAGSRQSPYPEFPRPRPEECKLAYKILSSLHGERRQLSADEALKAPADRAGCGDSPSVLDALVRTILSQNTSSANSTRAKLSMDSVYGSSDAWEAVVEGGQAKLQRAIESGGLAAVKSRVILDILSQTLAAHGTYSLDHLFNVSDDEAMRQLLAFRGVGPKTASCVLLFCLRRASFAVDTHVHRITGFLGWRPADATRDQTYAHLDARIPDEYKYGLHVLMVSHGKVCDECKAGGGGPGKTGSCELRKAFRKGKIKGEAGEEAKKEELD